MRQRGRKSAAQLATLSVNGDPPRLKPPADLADDERFLFPKLLRHVGRAILCNPICRCL
jgi:hypothetical protein